jgi:hypothetical protein
MKGLADEDRDMKPGMEFESGSSVYVPGVKRTELFPAADPAADELCKLVEYPPPTPPYNGVFASEAAPSRDCMALKSTTGERDELNLVNGDATRGDG